MLELRVTPDGGKPFGCRIDTENNRVETTVFVTKEELPSAPIRCLTCLAKNKSNQCSVFDGTFPVSVYFASLKTDAMVSVEYRDGDFAMRFTCEAYAVAMLLYMYVAFYSDCPYFNNYRHIVRNFTVNISPESFSCLVQAVIFSRRQKRLREDKEPIHFKKEAKSFCAGFSKRMFYVLINAGNAKLNNAANTALKELYTL